MTEPTSESTAQTDHSREVTDLLQGSTEMEASETLVEPGSSTDGLSNGASNNDIPGVNIALALLNVSVCCDLFHHLAHRRYNLRSHEARVSQMASDHPFFYRICRWIDLLTRVFLVLVLIATVSLVTWGVLRRTFFLDGFGIG